MLAAVDADAPDVVVTDIRMPPTGTDEGMQVAEWLRENHPDIGVVVLSQYAQPGVRARDARRGTAGRAYLLKERVDDVEQLAGAIRSVAGGGSVIDPHVVEALVAAQRGEKLVAARRADARERDVLREMAQGKNNASIARACSSLNAPWRR